MTERKKRILVVEDEPNMAFSLQFNLQAEGYDPIPAVNGRIAIDKFDNDGPFDLIILDGMLPEMDGFQVAQEIRKRNDKTQILMLTALGKDEDRIKGFESGIDDYVTKPFLLEEFLLRIRRMIQRSEMFEPSDPQKQENPVLKYGPFELNTELLKLKSPTGEHQLTAMESDIMKEFITNPNRVLSRKVLLDRVWGVRGEIETRTVDNFIVRLRKYIETDPGNPDYLVSVRGRGYRLKEG